MHGFTQTTTEELTCHARWNHISMGYISCVHKENGHKNWEDDWTNVLPVMTNQIT